MAADINPIFLSIGIKEENVCRGIIIGPKSRTETWEMFASQRVVSTRRDIEKKCG